MQELVLKEKLLTKGFKSESLDKEILRVADLDRETLLVEKTDKNGNNASDRAPQS